jgi:peptide/nickel transport system substrate-binding protein
MEAAESHWDRARGRGLSRRRLLVAATGAAGGLALAACGSRSSAGGRPATGQTAGKPKRGGTFNQPSTADPPSFDTSTRFVVAGNIAGMTLDLLLRYKSGPGIKYTDLILQPSLADTYEAPDTLGYTFHLHPGVTFADIPPVNGRALTSADVKYSFEYLSQIGQFAGAKPAPTAPMFEGIDSVQAPDPATVVVKFKAPFAPFLNNVAEPWSGILPHEVHDMPGGFDKNMIGSGAWQLDPTQSRPGQRWFFKRNPTYWRQGLPYIDNVDWITIPDDATQAAAFQSKQVDYLATTGMTYEIAQGVQKAVPTATLFSYLQPSTNHMYTNVSRPPLTDQRVRQAIYLCIDRDAMIKALADGKGDWALPGSEAGLFTQEETRKLLPHDPQQAKQLLSAAGFANGVDIPAIFPGTKYGQELIDQWQLIQQSCKQVGINIQLQSIDTTEESNRKRQGDFSLDISPKPLSGDLDEVLYQVFYSTSASNYGRVKDAKLDQLLTAQRAESDAAKRRDLWRQAITYIVQQSYATDLYYRTTYILWSGALMNFQPNQGDAGLPLQEAWLNR